MSAGLKSEERVTVLRGILVGGSEQGECVQLSRRSEGGEAK